MSEFQNATEPPKPVLEEAAREPLTTEFEKLGLEFSNLHPTIRAVIECAAVSTAHAKQQVENFVGWWRWPTSTVSPMSKRNTPL